jgi:hypothetical protein
VQLGSAMEAKSYNVEMNYINTNQQKCTEINQFITMQILDILQIKKKWRLFLKIKYLKNKNS